MAGGKAASQVKGIAAVARVKVSAGGRGVVSHAGHRGVGGADRLVGAGHRAPLVGAFLDHLEHERGNGARVRNTRLAAIHSLFRFARAAPSRARRT